ncbi:DNA-processing protein DprA [Eupransor demetentiae]|uniref:Predicted Rossmann fold nucleotide-binding protein DprA/Smf involved in DNA uptake (Smf) n=1 Tax=Eupransor demetentiae TaxID=3109584 RepID=A0ABP0EP01_9LACO|nr:Predicted Rossmann fold nucleotide-binding protein DprA/Smf involved in DNA uptake (Smf) [Lactobacillaceae bacterium LMG 33000]
MNLRTFLLAIAHTAGIGKVRANRVLEAVSHRYAPDIYPWSWDTLTHVLELEPRARDYQQLESAYQEGLLLAQHFKGKFLTYFDEQYPAALKEIYQPPLVLFYEGRLDALRLPPIAIVGTRTATPYALSVLRDFLPALVKEGIGIVSGLARGVDVMAHQLTFGQGGVPIAVVGTGLDVAYLGHHHQLQKQIGQQGLLLSEYPPKTGPRRHHFPDRNRIIAGLSLGTLVVEAKEHSGSLITANLALQANRQVLAVPGSIFSTESTGTNQLIQAGALPVFHASDIIEAIKAQIIVKEVI